MHSFHIPVMGIGFTIDTPLKVSQFGIDSSISLVDDILIERLRKMYCERHGLKYEEITRKTPDFRAKRITAYLNLIQELSKKKMSRLMESCTRSVENARQYFSMLPDSSSIKRKFYELLSKQIGHTELNAWLKRNLKLGSIDVNIMTKVDKENYIGNAIEGRI